MSSGWIIIAHHLNNINNLYGWPDKDNWQQPINLPKILLEEICQQIKKKESDSWHSNMEWFFTVRIWTTQLIWQSMYIWTTIPAEDGMTILSWVYDRWRKTAITCLYLRWVLEELGVIMMALTTIHTDNQGKLHDSLKKQTKITIFYEHTDM